MIKAFGSILDVLYGSFNHAFLIGGMQMMIIHIQEFTSLRIPCTTTISRDWMLSIFLYYIFYKRLSAIIIVLSKEI
jgi:hypothetical protein